MVRSRAWVFAPLAVAAGWALFGLGFRPSAGTAGSPSENPSPGRLQIAAGLSHRLQLRGENVRFWITVLNNGPAAVSDLRWTATEIPEYEVVSRSWCVAPTAAVSGRCDQLAATIEPGQQLAFWGELRAVRKHEERDLFVVLRWDGPGGESHAAVHLGVAETVTGLQAFLTTFGQFVKDFGLPILLAILGIAYQLWERKRAEIREEQDRKAQIERTWNTMLPISHEYNTKYYTPLAGAGGGFLSLVATFQQANQEQPGNEAALQHARLAFYYLLLFERRCREIYTTIGGFYFKDRTGEELVATSLSAYRGKNLLGQKTIPVELSRVLSHMDLNESFDAFMGRLGRDKNVPKVVADAMESVWQHFYGCLLRDTKEATSYMSLFLVLLMHEANRPYEYWYGAPSRLQLNGADQQTLQEIIQMLSKRPEASGLRKEAKRYLEQALPPQALAHPDRVPEP